MELRFWKRGEHRADATALAIQGLLTRARTPTSQAQALAVVESCVSLIADPFLQATVNGFDMRPGELHDIARDLLLTGNGVRLIDAGADLGFDLLRPYSFDVRGSSPQPDRWHYSMMMATPNGDIERRSGARGVIHCRSASAPATPWIGLAPWQAANLSSSAMAVIEASIKDEANTGNGRIWIAPDATTKEQATSMVNAIARSRGGQVVVESTRAGHGRGPVAAPAKDWEPTATGQDHTLGNVQMRDTVESSIAAAYGIPSAYLSQTATAPALREVKRLAFLNRTRPIAQLIADELTDKLDTNISINWVNLADQSVDVHLRARGAAALAGIEGFTGDALAIVGLK